MKTSKFLDRYNLVVEIPRKNRAPIQRIFMDRRGAIVWPTVDNPGYYCIFGLEDISVTHTYKPLAMMVEVKEQDLQKMCQKLIRDAEEWKCRNWYANLHTTDEMMAANELSQYLRRMRNTKVQVHDASEWSGFEEAMQRVHTLLEVEALEIPDRTVLFRQLDEIEAEDLKSGVERKFYAAAAFMHIVTSYILSPWVKPKKQRVNTGRGEGYR